ncbi:MAG: hypothetical protein WCH39_08940 [Schlesneria sp.]
MPLFKSRFLLQRDDGRSHVSSMLWETNLFDESRQANQKARSAIGSGGGQ